MNVRFTRYSLTIKYGDMSATVCEDYGDTDMSEDEFLEELDESVKEKFLEKYKLEELPEGFEYEGYNEDFVEDIDG